MTTHETPSYWPGTELEYSLPAHWASGLINGDFSSFDYVPDDPENCAENNECTRWLEAEELRLGQEIEAVACSEEPYFAHGNDGTDLGSNTLDYVFIAR